MKYKYYVLIAVFFVLVGCSASNVIRPEGKSNSKYAPKNEAGRNGIVKYLNKGPEYVKKARREDAYKIMYQNCNGKYNIVNENIRYEDGTNNLIVNSTIYSGLQYIYIEYKCL